MKKFRELEVRFSSGGKEATRLVEMSISEDEVVFARIKKVLKRKGVSVGNQITKVIWNTRKYPPEKGGLPIISSVERDLDGIKESFKISLRGGDDKETRRGILELLLTYKALLLKEPKKELALCEKENKALEEALFE